MTIYNGSDGSLNLYYKSLLISSFPLTKKKSFERYQYQGEYLILETMKQNINIKKMIYTFTLFCNSIYKRKLNKLPIRRSDHNSFLSCLFALMKLRIIENNDQNGYLVMGRKKLVVQKVV
jgi:hypothetical protein